VLALGVWIYQVFFPGDEKLIRKLLAQVAETATVKPNENPIFKLAGGTKLVGFFGPNAVLKVEVSGADLRSIRGRDELLQAITAARAGLQEARIELQEIQVNVDPGHESATAQLVASARINGGDDLLVQELKMRFNKVDGRWKIAQVETVKGLGL